MPWELEHQSVLDKVAEHIEGGTQRILLASPFIGREVGELLANQIVRCCAAAKHRPDIRVLTAFRMSTIELGVLSARALCALSDGGADIASIPNLHAKVVIVDDWALVGSGNLSQAGLDSLNVELGLSASPPDVQAAAQLFERWWSHAIAGGGLLTEAELKDAEAKEPSRTRTVRKQSPSDKGTPLSSPSSKYLKAHRKNGRALITISQLKPPKPVPPAPGRIARTPSGGAVSPVRMAELLAADRRPHNLYRPPANPARVADEAAILAAAASVPTTRTDFGACVAAIAGIADDEKFRKHMTHFSQGDSDRGYLKLYRARVDVDPDRNDESAVRAANRAARAAAAADRR